MDTPSFMTIMADGPWMWTVGFKFGDQIVPASNLWSFVDQHNQRAPTEALVVYKTGEGPASPGEPEEWKCFGQYDDRRLIGIWLDPEKDNLAYLSCTRDAQLHPVLECEDE